MDQMDTYSFVISKEKKSVDVVTLEGTYYFIYFMIK
jgi:hypothetical protein